jgi:hypothetical protein
VPFSSSGRSGAYFFYRNYRAIDIALSKPFFICRVKLDTMAQRKPTPFYLLLILLLCGVVSSCVDDPPPTPELTLGQPTELASFDVPVIGSITPITYNNKTIKVIVPANSFTTVKKIRVVKTPISSQTFGDKISPVTDLLTIDFGSDYPAHNIIIQIPTNDGKLDFTMGFYYDKVTKDLDAIPLCTPELDYTRIALRHSGDFFLSTILLSKLYGGFQTDFSISDDGTDIPNYGTSFTPTGQFAGTTLSTYWYYLEKQRKGEPHLYGLYNSSLDSGNNVWQDNTKAIFLTTETDKAVQWAANSESIHEQLVSSWDEITVHELTYAMMVTGKPQLMTIRESNKSTSLPALVYKLADSNAFIYDPNFPRADNRKLSLRQNTGKMYQSGVNLNDIDAQKGKNYLVFTFLGGKALQNWDAIGTAYQQAMNDTIGIVQYTINAGKYAPTPTQDGWGVFADSVSLTLANPNDTLTELYTNGKFIPYLSGASFHLSAGANKLGLLSQTKTKGGNAVWNGFSFITIRKQAFSITTASHVSMVENDVVLHSFFVKSPVQPIQYSWDMGDGSAMIQKTNIDSIVYRYKTPGSYKITLRVFDLAANTLLGTETTTIVIALNPVSISPSGLIAQQGIPYLFRGHVYLPSDITLRYEWNMGDGGSLKSNVFDSIEYSYNQKGALTMSLKIFDNSNNVLLGESSQKITINNEEPPTLLKLQSMKFVRATFSANFNYKTEYGQSIMNLTFGSAGGSTSDTAASRLIWSGTSFETNSTYSTSTRHFDSTNWQHTSYGTTDNKKTSGSLYPNLSKLQISSSSYHEDSYSNDGGNNPPAYWQLKDNTNGQGFTCNQVYIIKNTIDTIVYLAKGSYLENYMSNINLYYHESHQYYQGGPQSSDEYIHGVLWQDTTVIPTVIVTFWK